MSDVQKILQTMLRMPIGEAFYEGHPLSHVKTLEFRDGTGGKLWYVTWWLGTGSIIRFDERRNQPLPKTLIHAYMQMAAMLHIPTDKLLLWVEL